jgi:ABC-type glycerol-3-phosphate transport system permease component
MATESLALTKTKPGRKLVFTQSRRKWALRIFATVVMVVYTLVTIFPFYALFVRSFVSTKDASSLHLWIPKAKDVPMEAEVGNLSVFYNLDLKDLKEALGIPAKDVIMSRTTLRELAQQYNIPEERIKSFFKGFYTFNGWMTLLRTELQGTRFWAALFRTVLVTGCSLALIILLSIFTGYGLAGLRRRDQMAVYNLYLLQMVIPVMLIILPQYQLFQYIFRLIPGYTVQGSLVRDALQLLSLIMINIKGTALSTMIFVAAISMIPRDLEDSAMIDGASRMQYVRYVLLPLLKVPVISLVVIMLPMFYNQFLEPYVYLDPSNSTLLPFIQSTSGQFSTNFQVIYSGIFASVVPLIVIYLIFRRFFVEGVMAGAIKG